MQILAISGSLRAVSTNTALIDAISLCAPADMRVVRYRELGDLPLFNPDLDGDQLPPAVARLRDLVGASDGLLICSPEYARGVAGATKNALDWLVGSLEFPGKPVAVVNASQRATDADAHLRLTLRTMNAVIVESASIMVPLLGSKKTGREILDDADLHRLITSLVKALYEAIGTLRTAG